MPRTSHSCLILASSLLLALAGASSISEFGQTRSCFRDGDALTCRPRSVSQLNFDDAEEEQQQNIKSLDILCEVGNGGGNDDLLQDISTRFFRLEELIVRSCGLGRLPRDVFAGLANLRRLKISGESSLEVEDEALRGLDRLQALELSSSGLWTLNPGTCQHVPALVSLNLSGNHLTDLADVFPDERDCFPSLAHLDLSGNFLGTLGRVGLSDSLKTLDLSGNKLSLIRDDALFKQQHLEVLDLADNQLAALPTGLFQHGSALRALRLQNNSLSMLPSNMFEGLTSLVTLNLSSNSLEGHLLDKDSFAGLAGLKVLDLSHNKLHRVSSSTFNLLAQLDVLSLSNNALITIEPGTFVLSSNLQTLTLTDNRIQRLQSGAFGGLASLVSLNIDRNSIDVVEDSVFSDLKLLQTLSLEENRLTSVPSAVRSLDQLRTLDLGENDIAEVKVGDFGGLTKLYGLRLSDNRIKTVEVGALSNLTHLHVLNLARNAISEVAQGALNSLEELRALRLDSNALSDINGVVSGLAKLQWLNVSSNSLQWFDYAFVPSSLEWLDIRNNHIQELGNYYKLKSGFGLKTLEAGGNRISKLTRLSVPPSLEVLDLSDNHISEVEEKAFDNRRHLQKVVLTGNKLEKLSLASLRVKQTERNGERQPQFFLSGNPFDCDCHMEWLQQVNDIALNGQHATVSDLADVLCHRQQQHSNAGHHNASTLLTPISQVPRSDFLCTYKTHCFPTCVCCDFYACDCRMHCPKGCSCYHDSAWSRNVIQCSDRKKGDVPLLIPQDSTHIHLDGNTLGDIDSQSFIGRKRVISLFLNNSEVTSISRQTLSGLASLQELHLENNLLREIVGHEFLGLVSLRELYLQENDIASISINAFDSLTSLRMLKLDRNLLTSFPVWKMAPQSIKMLTLSKNLWSCECNFVEPFSKFLRSHQASVVDMDEIACINDSLTPIIIESKSSNLTCTKAVVAAEVNNNHALVHAMSGGQGKGSGDLFRQDLLAILVSSVLALILVLCLCLAACVFRAKIRTWLGKRNGPNDIYDSRCGSTSVCNSAAGCGSLIYQSTLNNQEYNNKLFDVYISYSIRDSDFVDHSLAPALENDSTSSSSACSYKLCLHQRDFPPSATLEDTVSVAAESSSRVIAVLSRPYLEAEWPHVKIPLRNSLGGKAGGKLILLFLDDIPETELKADHPELFHYTQSCASIRWGSPGFMSKLRFFLPEPAFLTFQRNVTLRTLQPTLSKSTNQHPRPEIMQLDRVSGVWTYTMAQQQQQQQQQQQRNLGSASTQSTEGLIVGSRCFLRNSLPSGAGANGAPHLLMREQQQQQQQQQLGGDISVVSSVYSHHTYQSIPELLQQQQQQQLQQPHIYHTLEPNLAQQQQQQQEAVYIDGNMEVVTKDQEKSRGDETSRVQKTKEQNSEVKNNKHHVSQNSSVSTQQLLSSSDEDIKRDEYIV